jgi:curved DNA-binding protein CbpA
MQRYHPDKCANDSEMAQLVLAIRLAYDVLSDPELRKAYDIEIKNIRVKASKFSPSFSINEGPIKGSQKNNPGKRMQKTGGLSNSRFILIVSGLLILYFGYEVNSSRLENQIVEKRRADEKKNEIIRSQRMAERLRKEAETAVLI